MNKILVRACVFAFAGANADAFSISARPTGREVSVDTFNLAIIKPFVVNKYVIQYFFSTLTPNRASENKLKERENELKERLLDNENKLKERMSDTQKVQVLPRRVVKTCHTT